MIWVVYSGSGSQIWIFSIPDPGFKKGTKQRFLLNNARSKGAGSWILDPELGTKNFGNFNPKI
jgi:hypothetical protein